MWKSVLFLTAVSNNSPSGCLHFFSCLFLSFSCFSARLEESERWKLFLSSLFFSRLFAVCRWKSLALTHVYKVICSEARATNERFTSLSGGIRSWNTLIKSSLSQSMEHRNVLSVHCTATLSDSYITSINVNVHGNNNWCDENDTKNNRERKNGIEIKKSNLIGITKQNRTEKKELVLISPCRVN